MCGMINTVICPKCGKAIEVTEALVHQIEQEISSNLEDKHKKDLEKVRDEVEKTIKKQLEEKNSLEFADLKKQLEEKDAKVRKMREEELQLREKTRKLEEKEKEMELEIVRRVDQERKKTEEAVLKQTQESYRLKEAEKEKVIQDLRKALDDAQRKAQQGSQQTQGEVAELDLEILLKELFPQDTIVPVGKGIRGADVSHVVKSPKGFICGVILWESKRTKLWSDEWLSKLKEDLRGSRANIPVIVSAVLPLEAQAGMGMKDGVWITSHVLVPVLASLLRKNLLDVAYQKAVLVHQGEKADLLYEYVTGHEFRNQVEAILDVYTEMKMQLERERIAFEKSWKAREGQLSRMVRSMANIYGSMQGVIGGSLPQVKGLELLDAGDEDGNSDRLL